MFVLFHFPILLYDNILTIFFFRLLLLLLLWLLFVVVGYTYLVIAKLQAPLLKQSPGMELLLLLMMLLVAVIDVHGHL